MMRRRTVLWLGAGAAVTSGRHNFGYWSTVIPAAFDFVAAALAGSA